MTRTAYIAEGRREVHIPLALVLLSIDVENVASSTGSLSGGCSARIRRRAVCCPRTRNRARSRAVVLGDRRSACVGRWTDRTTEGSVAIGAVVTLTESIGDRRAVGGQARTIAHRRAQSSVLSTSVVDTESTGGDTSRSELVTVSALSPVELGAVGDADCTDACGCGSESKKSEREQERHVVCHTSSGVCVRECQRLEVTRHTEITDIVLNVPLALVLLPSIEDVSGSAIGLCGSTSATDRGTVCIR